jgi:hypothetical protein
MSYDTPLSVISARALPFIIAPSGTMAANGAITLGTALPQTYANAYVYLPASAIGTGSAAGWYFAQFTSATLGTVFNNPYVSGPPNIPVNPVPFATAGPGAYTGVTTAVTGPSFTIPAGAMGPNGTLRVSHVWSFPGNGNNKTVAIAFGGVTIVSTTQTTNISVSGLLTLMNRGTPAAQVGGNSFTIGAAGVSTPNFAVNTAASQALTMSGTLAVATDFIVMEAALVEILNG